MNTDGSGRRQLTHGKYDDFDARYLPGGDILFLSTRKGTALQCSQWFSDDTRTADHSDSYVRCGGDNYRPVPVFTLHAMDAGGGNIRPLSAFENFEWAPSVADDGRILYTRWDYIDRFNGHFFSLWSANQDGTNPQLVYGNYTMKPQVKFEARSVPGSSKLVFTAAAHHSICGGTLCLLDRRRGTEGDAPLTRLTPEVPFPETEANGGHYYANPWPLSEQYFLVGWADQKLPPHCRVTDQRNPPNAMGLYLLDAFGNHPRAHADSDRNRRRLKSPVGSGSHKGAAAPRGAAPLFAERPVLDGEARNIGEVCKVGGRERASRRERVGADHAVEIAPAGSEPSFANEPAVSFGRGGVERKNWNRLEDNSHPRPPERRVRSPEQAPSGVRRGSGRKGTRPRRVAQADRPPLGCPSRAWIAMFVSMRNFTPDPTRAPETRWVRNVRFRTAWASRAGRRPSPLGSGAPAR